MGTRIEAYLTHDLPRFGGLQNVRQRAVGRRAGGGVLAERAAVWGTGIALVVHHACGCADLHGCTMAGILEH
jgi:hypothetical protein